MNYLALFLLLIATVLAVMRFFIENGRLTAAAILALIATQLLAGGVKWG